MWGIIIIIASFILAILTIIQENRAAGDDGTILGLTYLGFGMIIAAIIGLIAGIIQSIRQRSIEHERGRRLEIIEEKVLEIASNSEDPQTKFFLTQLANEIVMAGSSSRRSVFSDSDFSQSDFSGSKFQQILVRGADFSESAFDGSNFAQSRFVGCNFKGSDFGASALNDCLFHETDFSGADLSKIKFNKATVFPNK